MLILEMLCDGKRSLLVQATFLWCRLCCLDALTALLSQFECIVETEQRVARRSSKYCTPRKDNFVFQLLKVFLIIESNRGVGFKHVSKKVVGIVLIFALQSERFLRYDMTFRSKRAWQALRSNVHL